MTMSIVMGCLRKRLQSWLRAMFMVAFGGVLLLLTLPAEGAADARGGPGTTPLLEPPVPALAADSETFVEDFTTNTYKAYTDRADWSTLSKTLSILPASGGAHREPTVAADGQGGVYAVWSDLRNNDSNGDWDVYVQRLDQQGNRLWPQDRRVNSDTGAAYQAMPVIAVDADGNALVAWLDDRDEPISKGIYAQKLAPNGARVWAGDVRVNSESSYRVGWSIDSLALALDSDNNLVVAWQGIKNGNWSDPDVQLQKLDGSGKRLWADDVKVNQDTGHTQASLALDVNPGDEIVVAWVDDRNGGQDIYAQWLQPDGAPLWQKDLKISAGNSAPQQGSPSVVAVGQDRAVIVWRSGPADPPLDSGSSLILGQQVTRRGLTQWPGDQRVNQDAAAVFRGHPRAVATHDGEVLVLWEDARRGFELGTLDVYAQLLESNGARQWPGDRRVNPEDWRNWNLKPRVSVAGGQAWIVWNTDDDVYLQAFDLEALAPRLSLPALANEADGRLDQIDPDISQLDQNHVLVAWEEVGRNNWDIRAQVIDIEGQTSWPTGVRVNDADIAVKRQRLRVATNKALQSLLVWHDEQGGVYGQVLTNYGVPLWDRERRFDSRNHRAYNPAVTALTDGSFVIAWLEERTAGSQLWDIYLQRLDAAGHAIWPGDVRANTSANAISEVDMRSSLGLDEDAQGHLVVAWRGEQAGGADIYMRRFSAMGSPDWPTELALKVGLYTNSGRFEDRAFAILAGNEITVASYSAREGRYGIYVQRLSLDGQQRWTPGAWLSSYTTTTTLGNPSLAATHDNGVIVVWDEEPGPRDTYAQRLDAFGAVRWPASLKLNRARAWPLNPQVASAAGSGYVAVWHDERRGDNSIYARRFTVDGQLAWADERDLIPHEFFYNRTAMAESTTIAQSPVTSATLLVDQTLDGGTARYYLSNDGGGSWDEVVPGLSHRFRAPGNALRWRSVLGAGADRSSTPVVREIRIRYGVEEAKDAYEPDDACAQANAIAADGSFQDHTFHVDGDLDWVRFAAVARSRYAIAAVHTGDLADVKLELYDACAGERPIAGGNDFGHDTTLIWTAPDDGIYYLRMANHVSSDVGVEASYRVSVRPVTVGAAIIVGGRLEADEKLQEQITFMTNHAYRVFSSAGYTDDGIYYLSADPVAPPHSDAVSVSANLAYAVRTWAPQHLPDGAPLYVYLADHGASDRFYLDTDVNAFTPDDLDQWLQAFENRRPHSPVIVIIEACRSGSFISPPRSLSRPNRIIITSTDDSTESIAKGPQEGGAYFSDPFFDALGANMDLWTSFEMGVAAAHTRQTPWLDGNGNGVPYPTDPADEGIGHNLGLGRQLGYSGQAPYIVAPDAAVFVGSGLVRIRAEVLDEDASHAKAWIEVTRPSTPPPSPPPGYTTPISHAKRLDLTYNPETERFETNFLFDEVGKYQFVFQAEDAGEQRAQPVVVEVQGQKGEKVYLPSVLLEGSLL